MAMWGIPCTLINGDVTSIPFISRCVREIKKFAQTRRELREKLFPPQEKNICVR